MKTLRTIIALLCVCCLILGGCTAAPQKQPDSTPDDSNATAQENTDVGSETNDTDAEVPNTVKIALVAPMSGSSADWGNEAKRGAELAAEIVNANGGIQSLGGAKLEITYTDSTSDATQVPTILERVLSSDDYVATLGLCTSPLSIAGLPIAEKYKVPLFANGSADDLCNSGYNYVFRVAPNNDEIATATNDMLVALRDEYGVSADKIGIIYENTNWGISSAEGGRDYFEAAGFTISVYESYSAGLTDASAIVSKLKNAGCEVVYVMSQPADLKLIINTMDTMQYDPLLMGGGGAFLFYSFYEELGEATEGIISVGATCTDSKFVNASEEGKAVVQMYEEKYGQFMQDHAQQTLIQIMCVVETIENTGVATGEAVCQELHSATFTNPYACMMQPGTGISFGENGEINNCYGIIVQWRGGKLVTVYPEEAASEELILGSK